jgi:hypothetical protein
MRLLSFILPVILSNTSLRTLSAITIHIHMACEHVVA